LGYFQLKGLGVGRMRQSICGYVEDGKAFIKTLGNQGKVRCQAVALVLPESIKEMGL